NCAHSRVTFGNTIEEYRGNVIAPAFVSRKNHPLEPLMFKKSLTVSSVAACIGALFAGKVSAADGESTTVGARIFARFSYIDQKSDGVKTDASGAGTDVKRAYVIVTHKFDDTWAANVTTDFNYTGSSNYSTVFIKKAYVQATLSEAFVARLGSA